ncbi:MAG: cyclic nucleotide-binding domain-containing protein [Candidatus Aureabacteria bacterium]|nr:cyclic nucleotide-binding domain-containing protein [Candidatus Auribacterota bacterium]
MKLSLERVLRTRRQEQPLLLLMMGTIALFQFCQILNENFSATVFLKRYGVRYLPTTFFLNSLVFLVLLLLLHRVVDRCARTRLVSQLLLLYAVTLAGLRLLILSGLPLAYPVTYIAVKQMKYVFFIVFWTLASDIYSTRKARRLFPLIGGGAVLGTISGSMLSAQIARVTGTDNVVLFSAAGMLISYLLIGFGRRQVARLSPLSYSPKEEVTIASLGKFFRRELFQIRGSSLLNYLMLLALLPGILGPLFEYIFKYLANQTFRSESSLLGFFGIYNGSYNLLVLIFQIVCAGSVFRRYGIVNVLFTYPCGYFLSFVALCLHFRMPTAIVGDASLEVIDAAFYKPGCQMLYNIIPMEFRGRVSALVQGAVRRLGELAGSGMLWVLILFIPAHSLTLVGPVFALLWVLSTYFLRRSYSAILYRSLSEKHVNFAELESRDLCSLMTRESVRLLSKGLSSEDAGTALMAARLLSQSGIPGWPELVCAELPRREGAVQIEMLRIVGAAPPGEVAEAMLCVADRVHEAARTEVARIVRRVAPERGRDLFRKWAKSENPQLVAESILGLKAVGENVDEAWALSKLHSHEADEVCSALYFIGETGDREVLPQLYPLLDSREVAVRAECALAVGKLGVDAAADMWEGLLNDREAIVRLKAVEGLDALGTPGAARRVIRLLGDEDGAVRAAARSLIVRQGEGAIPLLTEALPAAGLFTRTALIGILDQLGVKEQTLLAFIDDKVREGYRTVARMRVLDELPAGRSCEVVSLLLQNRLGEAIYEIFRALGLLLKGSRMQFILERYHDREESVREHALEALEDVLTPYLARRLLPLLEDLPIEMKCAAGKGYYGAEAMDLGAVLEEMLKSENTAEKMCALMCIAEAREKGSPALTARLREMASKVEEGLKVKGGQSVEDLMEKVLTLKGIPIFSHLHFKELLAIASISREESFHVGDEIVKEGERGDSMYIIVSGVVRIVSGAAGERVHLATLKENDYFGEMALFDDSPRSASAIADGDVRALAIYKQEFRDMLREYPGVSIMMCEEFCRRLRRTIEKVSV